MRPAVANPKISSSKVSCVNESSKRFDCETFQRMNMAEDAHLNNTLLLQSIFGKMRTAFGYIIGVHNRSNKCLKLNDQLCNPPKKL